MTGLYELLGVKKNATVKAIRKSYRTKAKKAHPDTGGDVETFAALKKAHDILTDPDRRQKYDATGDTSEKAIDNSLSAVIGMLAQAMENVITQIEGRRGEITEFDIVNDMKILIGGHLDEIQKHRNELKSKLKKAERLLGRFGVKDGQNYLEDIILAKISFIANSVRLCDEQEIPVRKALDILTISSFKSDLGGSKAGHQYGGQSAYRIADLMNAAMYGAMG